MMKSILEDLIAQRGVLATLLINPDGQVLRHTCVPRYDQGAISAVAGALRRCADALISLEASWKNVDVCFMEGILLLRTLDGEANPMLAVVADKTADRGVVTEATVAAVRQLEMLLGPETEDLDLPRRPSKVFANRDAEEIAGVLTRGLAGFVGARARACVQEAIGAICGDRPFGINDAIPVMREAAESIDSASDRDAFLSMDLAELHHY